jgi:hypothetical protein
MLKKQNNFAFIDSQNLNLAIQMFGRYMNDLQEKLEYKKERPPEDGTSEGDLSRW